jgi:DNA polymerase V
VVVAAVDGELVVKRLRLRRGCPVLVAEGEGYPELVIGEDQRFQVWGVVTNVVHSLEGGRGPDRAR